ncbi:MAG TPA: phosphomethylpyrimidine synthase ThiC, partial [Candidatus Cloacimonadota bacterium]|nr:phosphomethylpyrimidine synthase ThiC [Candidatus Cloacimonadota bacterium]
MTIINDAKNNVINKSIKECAIYEQVPESAIIEGLCSGTIVIPKNNNRSFTARAIGKGLTTKININLGTSENNVDIKEELKKLEVAIQFGADSFMDLSTAGRRRGSRSQDTG